jgi:hypothetical protein
MLRKLKSIQQILTEYPNAKFKSNGVLDSIDWSDSIVPEMFTYFGKEILLINGHYNGHHFIEKWLEPMADSIAVELPTDNSIHLTLLEGLTIHDITKIKIEKFEDYTEFTIILSRESTLGE